jgi:hypothetical protein
LAQGDAERTEVFTAALEQSEQLMRAAEGTGYATKPLPLFYSLSQAGRAIAAARLDDPAWRLRGHGVAVGDGEDPITETLITCQPTSEKIKLKYVRTDSFSGVSAAAGSAAVAPESKVKLGEVWAAIPDPLPGLVQRMYGLGIDQWRRPRVVYDEYDIGTNEYVRWRGTSLLIGGFPSRLTAPQIYEELSWYPALAGAVIRTDPHLGDAATGADVMRARAPDGQECPKLCYPGPWETHPKIDDVAPMYNWTGYRIIHPKLRTGEFLAPIMLWWLLLLGLSSIARYNPEAWISTLNVNDSPAAVAIEVTLDTAVTAVPNLILQALLD